MHFRDKEYKQGRLDYKNAVTLAPDESSKKQVALFRAREELNANTPEADNYVEKVLKFKFSEDEIDGPRIQELLAEQYKKARHSPTLK